MRKNRKKCIITTAIEFTNYFVEAVGSMILFFGLWMAVIMFLIIGTVSAFKLIDLVIQWII